jgi:serine/threonine-protein kinase
MPFCKKCGKKLEDDAVFCPQCGTPVGNAKASKQAAEGADDFKTQLRAKASSYGTVNLENLPVGYIIDERYEVKEKIGQGGFGAVYRVFDRNMEVDKALKVIPEVIVSDKEAMFDLQKEAKTMISLNHANIVRVYDFHQSGSIKYIDMEYVDGKTLTEVKLDYPNKQVPEAKVKELAVKIADGLAYAHSKGIIHKDIKPQNVMLTKDGDVKIMDFGLIFGAGVEFGKITVDARYNLGLTTIDDSEEEADVKNSVISIMVGYSF